VTNEKLNTAEAAIGRNPAPNSEPSSLYILKDLFRKEAVDHAHNTLGAPVKLLGVAGWVLSTFFVLLLVAALAFLISARYARKETVFGQVTPTEGAFRITSQNTGIAERVLVHEGQLVKAGDELVTITSNPMLQSGESLAAGLKAIQLTQRRAQELQATARLEQVQRQIEELNARNTGLTLDLERLGDARKLLEKRRQLHIENLTANRALAEKGMVSAAFLRQHEDALLAVEQQIQQTERDAAMQGSQLAQIVPQLGRLAADAQMASSEASAVKAQFHERQLNSEAQLSRNLVAPINGMVTALQVRAGAPVQPGQTLAVIIPMANSKSGSQLEVELWAPSKAIGFVKAGAKVRIMYDAFPYQTFGVGIGTVHEVSGTPVSPNELPVPIETREQLFRIRVALERNSLEAYQRQWSLVPGMRLSADLILEEQSLLDWILAPLRAANKRAI